MAVPQFLPEKPGKMIAVHVAFESRAAQRGRWPKTPSYFLKATSTLAESGGVVERPAGTELLAFEGEIALIIGKAARNVSLAEAWDYVAYVTASNDLGIYDYRAQDFTHSSTRKVTFQAHRMDKVAVVAHALQAAGRGRTIIFARTKRAAAQLADDLARRGFHVGAVHGDLGQKSREKSLHAFRTGQVDILVATDIAARGIDVDDVTHVINYQVPDDPMTFVHRIGRTGRAGHTGTAITMVGYDELAKWQVINDELDLGEPNPPQWFSTSPELAQALDIPAEVEETVGPETKVVGQVPVREKSPTRTTARRGSSRRRRGGRRRHHHLCGSDHG